MPRPALQANNQWVRGIGRPAVATVVRIAESSKLSGWPDYLSASVATVMLAEQLLRGLRYS
jgi:hypothetical protein